MARILFADDDLSLLEVLGLALEDAGHEVLRAEDGLAALSLARRASPDLIVSDVTMPGLDGFTLCKRLREAGDPVPILLLTSRDGELDEALGLELGADDYVSKPFATRVVLARVAALLRRKALSAEPGGARTQPLRAGDLSLDPERILARYKGTALDLTVTEYRLLEALARRPGVVFSRERLLELARGDDSAVVARIVDTYVARLRRKLEAIDPGFDTIETVVGAGYRWKG
jgi:DNA-binding response OmpR family regulator